VIVGDADEVRGVLVAQKASVKGGRSKVAPAGLSARFETAMRGIGLATSITLLRVSIAGAATPTAAENIGANPSPLPAICREKL
jgi:hypothetical protein